MMMVIVVMPVVMRVSVIMRVIVPVALCSVGQVPVSREATEGSVQPEAEIAWSKRTPSLARASMRGVSAPSSP